MKTKTVVKHLKRSGKKTSKLIASKAKKRILKKKQAEKLLRAFAILVFTVSAGSLV